MKTRLSIACCLAAICGYAVSVNSDDSLEREPTAKMTKHVEEAGYVNWMRDYDSAMARSKADKKPVFVLFQEIPG